MRNSHSLGLPLPFVEKSVLGTGLTVLERKVLPVADPRGFLTADELRRLEEENPGLCRGDIPWGRPGTKGNARDSETTILSLLSFPSSWDAAVALPREGVAELIASPQLFAFPHTTPLITGLFCGADEILPVLDLGPAFGRAFSFYRFFLWFERHTSMRRRSARFPCKAHVNW